MTVWKRSVILVLLVAMAVPAIVEARQPNDYEWKTWRTKRSHAGFNGFGGFFFSGQMYESTGLQNLATAMGVSGLEENLVGMGGWGMAHMGNGWRIGGLGFGYTADGSGVFEDSNGDRYNRSLQVDVGGGGFVVEYSPWMIGPVNLGLGSVLGWGGVIVKMHQNSGTFDWSDLSGQYSGTPAPGENITTELMQPFVMAEPYVTARIHILHWMAFSATAGYHLNSLRTENWYMLEQKMTDQGPDLNMNNVFVRVGLVFGG